MTIRHCARPADGYIIACGQSFKCNEQPLINWLVTLLLYIALLVFVLLFTSLMQHFDAFDL